MINIRQATSDDGPAIEALTREQMSIKSEPFDPKRFQWGMLRRLYDPVQKNGFLVAEYVDSDSTRLNATDAQLVIGPLTIDPGTVGAGGTVVTEAVISENTITLDSLEIKILENDTLYIGELITLMDTDGNPVRLSGDDYYTVQAVIEVEYLFDGEF